MRDFFASRHFLHSELTVTSVAGKVSGDTKIDATGAMINSNR